MPFDQENETDIKDQQIEDQPTPVEEAPQPEEAAAAPEEQVEEKVDVAPSIEVKRPPNNAKYPLGTPGEAFLIEYHGAASKEATIVVVFDGPGLEVKVSHQTVRTDETGKAMLELAWEIGQSTGNGTVTAWGAKTNEGGATPESEIQYEVVDVMQSPSGDKVEPAPGDDPEEQQQQQAAG